MNICTNSTPVTGNLCNAPLGGSPLRHRMALFTGILSRTPIPQCVTLDELYTEYSKFAENATYIDPFPDAIKAAKLHAPAAIHAELDGLGRDKCHFKASTLVTIDIDQKSGTERYSFEEIEQFVQSLNLDAILYSTISHMRGNTCLRAILNAGMALNGAQYKECVRWFSSKLRHPEVVDSASLNYVQLMSLPTQYTHVKPIVKRVHGSPLFPQYSLEIDSAGSHPEPCSMQTSSTPSSYSDSPIDPDFLEHLSLLHPDLIPHRLIGGSLKFYRNSSDPAPGLFVGVNLRRIRDSSKNKSYDLFYSHSEFVLSKSHHSAEQDILKRNLLNWEIHGKPYSLFRTNAGFGKSQTLQSMVGPCLDGRRRVFSFHTRQKRDDFIAGLPKSAEYFLVKSGCEIVGDAIGEDDRRERVLSELGEAYEVAMYSAYVGSESMNNANCAHQPIIKSLIDEEYSGIRFENMLANIQDLTDKERCDIIKEVKMHNTRMNSSKCLIMTTKKLDYVVSYTESITIDNSIVYTDEIALGMLTYIPEGTVAQVYRKCRPEIGNPDIIDYKKLRSLKRCLITIENGIDRELAHHDVQYDEVCSPSPTFDPNLEVLLVDSTSDVKGHRTKIFEAIAKLNRDWTVISDGLKKKGCIYNHVNTKGMNNLSDKPIVIISTYPAPSELATAMISMQCDEETAKSILMSNKANQAIGRNQGYRNRGKNGNPSSGNNKCLLVAPRTADLNLHYVTPNCLRLKALSGTSKSARQLFQKSRGFYFSDVIDSLLGIDDPKVFISRWLRESWKDINGKCSIKKFMIGTGIQESINFVCEMFRSLGQKVEQRGKTREMFLIIQNNQ